MKILKKSFAMLIVAVMLMSVMGISAFAATPCYLFEDFETNDFMYPDATNVPPTHYNGSSENFSASATSDGLYSIETDETGNKFLRFQSQGTGSVNNQLELKSSIVANAQAPIYNYSVSYDIKFDAWDYVDASGNVIDHVSRFLHIHHGGANTATLKVNGGNLTVCDSDGSSTGVGNGSMDATARLFDTSSGVGDKHHIRFTYRKGDNGEGLVSVFFDGACVIDDAKYSDSAKALPSNGRYFGVRAEDNAAIGRLRTSIRFDNIRLEYDGMPDSVTEPYGDGVLRAMNGRMNTTESRSGNTVTFNHVYNVTVDNDGAGQYVNVIIAKYNNSGVMESVKTSRTYVAANETKDMSVTLTGSKNYTQTGGYDIRAYAWSEDYKPLHDVTRFERGELDWAFMELDSYFNTDKVLNWLVGLYDMNSGGMYYSNSSKLNPADYVRYDSSLNGVTFGPHIESTYGGMVGALPYLNAEAKAKLATWVKSTYDASSGYFVEANYKSTVLGNIAGYESKLGRDLGYARGILKSLGYMDANNNFITPANTVSLMATSEAITDNLGSWSTWKAWLDRQDWSESGVWGTCHKMESQSGAIIAAGYKKQTAEYIAAKVNSTTGMLGGLSYDAMSGSLKSMWAFGTDSIPYPYVEKLFENAVPLINTGTPDSIAQVINLPVGLQGARNSYAASGTALPTGVNKTLDAKMPELVRGITKQLATFYKSSTGTFGYSQNYGMHITQGVRISLGNIKINGSYAFNEADVNGQGLADRARSVLYSFAGRTASTVVPGKMLAARINALWDATYTRTATETKGFTIGEKGAMSPESVWTFTKIKK